MTQNKMGEDAESDFAIPFVDENDYSEISAKAVPAKPKLRASLCKILISSFAHKMDFAHNFSVDFF